MSEERIIKKYANRRLYDTERSVYVTLADVRELVTSGVEFVIQEDSTGEDITRQILLQVISEQENGGQPMFTKELLAQMIRFYGGAYQSMFTDYMNRTMQMFTAQQANYQKQFNEMLDASGFSAASEIAKQNMDMWNDVQKNMLKLYGLQPDDKGK